MVAVTGDGIRAARDRIPAVFRDSAQFVCEPLSETLGVPVVVKVEIANPIGCFKGRGTWLAVSELLARGEVGERQGIVVASAGNFGQGVAYAGRAMRVPVVVFAAETANRAKVAAMVRLGADVRLAGEDFDAARGAAASHAVETGWRLLVDGSDPWIALGAGSMACELTDAVQRGSLPALSSVYVPVGNGALIAGIGAWMRHAAPETRVVGVQAAGAPAMTLSWRAKRAIETERADTIADGIAARVPVPEALAVMFEVVDQMLLVDDPSIVAATEHLAEALPLAIEPSAGAAWAAALQQPPRGAIALILTGGNVAPLA
ncbi:MAG: pyridoxal-phosphate dependent enzyme [Chloroflexota bacterium]|nr:pyridoxal-phosphate dependent enzyme [Chloroflexota bacterium]